MIARHIAPGLLALLVVPLPAAAQPVDGQQSAAADGSAAILAAREVLVARYVRPDVAVKLGKALADATAAGAFRNLSGDALAARVTAEMGKVISDGHLRLTYQPALAALLPSADVGDPPKSEAWNRALEAQLRRTNAGVRKLELLPGNIRYLAYDSFGGKTPGAQQALATAMEFLRDGDAIIIDLRNNPGGYADAEAAMASYFLPPQTRLLNFEMRGGAPADSTETSVAPFSLAGKPTYVLIGPATLSAAEGFAAHVSSFGFGTLVGETTGGAGYTVRGFPLPGGYVLNVSVGRTINAASGADWEGTGVAPTIVVPADKALVAAQAAAAEKTLAGMPDAERPQGERLLAFYRAQAYPVATALPLSAYVGNYGDFTVATANEGLTIGFRDFSPEQLIPLAPNLFAPDAEPTTQVRFIAEHGAIVALELDSGNGPPARTGRRSDGE